VDGLSFGTPFLVLPLVPVSASHFSAPGPSRSGVSFVRQVDRPSLRCWHPPGCRKVVYQPSHLNLPNSIYHDSKMMPLRFRLSFPHQSLHHYHSWSPEGANPVRNCHEIHSLLFPNQTASQTLTTIAVAPVNTSVCQANNYQARQRQQRDR